MTGSALLGSSPLGPIRITVEGEAVTAITWGEHLEATPSGDPTEQAVLEQAVTQLRAYFAGDLRRFDLPLAPRGTAFQKRVWDGLLEIPYGEERTYGQLAERVGSVARAVGGACGANPIAIVIPCHRVLGGGGRLVGFSASGGLADKRVLLDFERGEPGLPLG